MGRPLRSQISSLSPISRRRRRCWREASPLRCGSTPISDEPLYVSRGEGPYLYGLDGKRYIDFNMSNGAALLGHDHPAVKQAVLQASSSVSSAPPKRRFTSSWPPGMVEIIPAAERVRFSSVGTEVTLVALAHCARRHRAQQIPEIRRAFPRPDRTVALSALPIRSIAAARSFPAPAAVPYTAAADVVMVPWNDVEAFEAAMRDMADELAAVICEPIHYNAGCIPPEPGFLELLRERTRRTRRRASSSTRCCPVSARTLGGVQAPLRRHARPDDARQGAGERPSPFLGLRPRRSDGSSSAPTGAGRPQRHLFRPPPERAGRAGHPR